MGGGLQGKGKRWYNTTEGGESLGSIEVARRATEAASDKKAKDILMLDIRQRSTFAEFFVICSGETDRHLKAIVEEVHQAISEEGETLLHQEGTIDSGWVLLDFGDVIVHVFSPQQREYYALEELWADAIPLVRIH